MTKKVNFGNKQVDYEKKDGMVQDLFNTVAPYYDKMNDLMSLGYHRLWKEEFVFLSRIRPSNQVLEVASGSGDISLKLAKIIQKPGKLVITDPNKALLNIAKDKLMNNGFIASEFVTAFADSLPFPDNSFDRILISFGLRNVTDIPRVLREFYRILKPNGMLSILDFSRPNSKFMRYFLDAYSRFFILPLANIYVKDQPSYKYLVESIKKHPDQSALIQIINEAGFFDARYINLSHGITAVHQAYK